MPVEIGAESVRHGRHVTVQLAEGAVHRTLFRAILRRVDDLRGRLTPAKAEGIDETRKRLEKCIRMARKMTAWPCKHGPISRFV